MNKPDKRDSLNLIFSAFLVLGYIVCSYFFLTMAQGMPDIAPYINAVVFAVFGLVVFYATRVGEGKAVKRFSLWTLLILDIPALYIVLAQIIEKFPLHQQIANLGGTTVLSYSPLFILACVALGYGIPYTFLSGYELNTNEDSEKSEDFFGFSESEDNEETTGAYFLATEDTAGALLVVDDLDTAFDPAKEIRISDATPCEEGIAVGSFVVYAEAVFEEEAEEADEEVAEVEATAAADTADAAEEIAENEE